MITAALLELNDILEMSILSLIPTSVPILIYLARLALFLRARGNRSSFRANPISGWGNDSESLRPSSVEVRPPSLIRLGTSITVTFLIGYFTLRAAGYDSFDTEYAANTPSVTYASYLDSILLFLLVVTILFIAGRWLMSRSKRA